jgi:hypothetical protein
MDVTNVVHVYSLRLTLCVSVNGLEKIIYMPCKDV